jgi:TldD protein
MPDDQDLAEYAVNEGRNKGSNYAEARIITSRDESVVARNGLILSAQEKTRTGIGIRVLVDGGMAFGSTEKMSTDSIDTLLDSLIKLAKTCNRKNPIQLSEEASVETSWITPRKIAFETIPKTDKTSYVKQLDKSLKQEFGKNLPSRIIMLIMYSDQKYIVTSDGIKVHSEYSLPAIFTMNTAKGKAGGEQRFFSKGGSGGWEWYEEEKIHDVLLNDNKALVRAADLAKKITFEKPIDIVISGEVSGIMAHENIGHPSEGDRILGREGAQAGESFYSDLLKTGELGNIQLGNECVTIIDDPTVPNSAGFYLYDDEGVQARPRYLVKNGKLNELFLNREYAARFETHSNAAARAIAYDREPIVRMANTYFAPGDYQSKEELCEDIKNGVYLASFTEWNIDDRRFQSKYVGLEAYLIQDGKLTESMIRRPVLELTTVGILSSVDGIGKEIEWPYGTCGKGDPQQGVPVSLAGPHLRLRNITIGGGL